MMKYQKITILTLAAGFLTAAAFVPVTLAGAGKKGHSHSHDEETAYGKPGDPKRKSRVVEILMKEGEGTMSFEPALVTVKKGRTNSVQAKECWCS